MSQHQKRMYNIFILNIIIHNKWIYKSLKKKKKKKKIKKKKKKVIIKTKVKIVKLKGINTITSTIIAIRSIQYF